MRHIGRHSISVPGDDKSLVKRASLGKALGASLIVPDEHMSTDHRDSQAVRFSSGVAKQRLTRLNSKFELPTTIIRPPMHPRQHTARKATMSTPPQGHHDSVPLPNEHPTSTWHDHELTRRQVIAVSGGVLASTQMNAWSASEASGPGRSEGTVNVRLTINGGPVEIQVDARQSLLDVLRERLNLTGTKKGCNQGACGACTVLVDGRRINACLTLAAMHDGAEITTVEGLATGGALHPLQTAFIEHEGFQCGYCTAGQLMSGVACIREGHAKTASEVQAWMSGNICRCGAYPGIVSAVIEVARSQTS